MQRLREDDVPLFYFHLSGAAGVDEAVEIPSAHEAINDALNALHLFTCHNFPPPENVSITVSDEWQTTVATLKISFQIEYAKAVLV